MPNSPLPPPDLEKILFQIGEGLHLFIADRAYDSFRQAVVSAPDVDAPELRSWLTDRFASTEFTGAVGRDYVARAWISYVLAEQAKKNGDLARAWYYVSQARFHEGQMDAELAAMERIDRIRKAGRKGGQTTGVERSRLMRECIALLAKQRPGSGWKSHKDAFDSICVELLDFSARDGDSLTRDALSSKVMEWLATQPKVRAAYQGESRQP